MSEQEAHPALDVLSGKQALDVDSELVNKIFQKTREEKISWTRTPSGYSGYSPSSKLTMELKVSHDILNGRNWESFIVKQGATDLLTIQNRVNALWLLAGGTPGLAHKGVRALFDHLESARARQVRSALDELDKL